MEIDEIKVSLGKSATFNIISLAVNKLVIHGLRSYTGSPVNFWVPYDLKDCSFGQDKRFLQYGHGSEVTIFPVWIILIDLNKSS